jgi:hypothetical protein
MRLLSLWKVPASLAVFSICLFFMTSQVLAVTIPAAPSNLTGYGHGGGILLPPHIDLNWRDNSNNETGFKIEASRSATSSFVVIATVGQNKTALMIQDPPYGVSYFRVRAYNAAGYSPYSNVLRVNF